MHHRAGDARGLRPAPLALPDQAATMHHTDLAAPATPAAEPFRPARREQILTSQARSPRSNSRRWRWVETRSISSSPSTERRYSSAARSADPRPEQPCAVVGDDRLGAIAAPAIADLADVLKHAQGLDSLAGASGGDLIEIGQRRDVGGLIEAEQQRRIDRAVRRRRAVKRGRHHVGDQRREQPAQAPLVLRRGDQVERVAPRQQPV